ncbi:hypothetical protein ACLVWU_10335 [Bdellovibrio sp. HCB290]
MSSEQNTQEDSPAQSKTLTVLGLTFVLPVLITLIAVWILI